MVDNLKHSFLTEGHDPIRGIFWSWLWNYLKFISLVEELVLAIGLGLGLALFLSKQMPHGPFLLPLVCASPTAWVLRATLKRSNREGGKNCILYTI